MTDGAVPPSIVIEPAAVAPYDQPASLLRAKLVRYAIASIGPIGSSATQFILSLTMLRLMPPIEFGAFTFLLVASQLSCGVWSAMFCSALPVFLARDDPDARRRGETTLLAASLLGALLAIPVFGVLGSTLGLRPVAVACFAASGSLVLIRWFGRAYAYFVDEQLRTMCSDVAYSFVVLATLALSLLLFGLLPQTACYLALLAGAAAGLLPFGRSFFRRQFALPTWAILRTYASIWRGQARWALLGVVTTEATANAHVYIITLLQGPGAMAPIAASALLMRPVNVAQNALAEFERPQMARLIGERAWPALRSSGRHFALALGTIWVGSILASLALFLAKPRLLFPASYDLRFIAIAAAMWAVFAALRLGQTPPSVMLQAGGEFRPLAFASIWSSVGSVVGVLVLVATVGALWSIAGLIIGAAIFLYWTHRAAARWLRDRACAG